MLQVEGFGSNEWVYPADEATQGLLRLVALSARGLFTVSQANTEGKIGRPSIKSLSFVKLMPL